MANQNFLDGGPAVWLARHTLGVEIDEDYPANRLGVIANQQPNNYPTVEVISNPAKKFIYLLIEDQITPFKYELYNSVGQLVLNGELTANESTIDISKISNGFYVFKIINWNQMMTSKIVIQND